MQQADPNPTQTPAADAAGREMTPEEVAEWRAKNNKDADGLPLILTIEDVEGVVVEEQYHTFPGTTMTVCCLKTFSGFAVVGEAACVRPEQFRQDLGEKYSRADAMRKLALHEGYRLKDAIYFKALEKQGAEVAASVGLAGAANDTPEVNAGGDGQAAPA